MANSVDPDETALYEPSHLDLLCLHRYLVWSSGLTGLKAFYIKEIDTHLREITLSKLLCLPSEKGSILKGTNLLPCGATLSILSRLLFKRSIKKVVSLLSDLRGFRKSSGFTRQL